VRGLVCFLLGIMLLAVIARSFLSFFPGGHRSPIGMVLTRITEPLLGPVRQVIRPRRLGAGMVDLAPLAVSFGIIVLRSLIC
jgi:YggT family protein